MRGLRVLMCASLFVGAVFSMHAQTPQSKWQSGTITAVTPHAANQSSDANSNQYEVSVRVGDALYVVLYTAPPGSQTVRYRAGTSLQVLIEGDTLTFNDLLGRANKVPVLRREVVH